MRTTTPTYQYKRTRQILIWDWKTYVVLICRHSETFTYVIATYSHLFYFCNYHFFQTFLGNKIAVFYIAQFFHKFTEQ